MKVAHKRVFDKIKLETFDSCYRIPKIDYKYVIRETPIVKDDNSSEFSYMTQVIKRGKSMVDPRKYSKQIDWGKQSVGQYSIQVPRQKKVSDTAELMLKKKAIPAPSAYKQWIPPKTHGFYGNSCPRTTPMEELMFLKRPIPSSTQYNTFKGISQTIKEKWKARMSQATIDSKRKDFVYQPIKKNN